MKATNWPLVDFRFHCILLLIGITLFIPDANGVFMMQDTFLIGESVPVYAVFLVGVVLYASLHFLWRKRLCPESTLH